MKNVLKIVLLFAILSVAPLSATTDVYACGTYNGTTDHHFVIHNDVYQGTYYVPCLDITNISSGADLEIECGGHWISAVSYLPLTISSITPNIYLHDCNMYSVVPWYNTNFTSVGIGTSGWFYGYNNVYFTTEPRYVDSGTIYSDHEFIYSGELNITNCAGAVIVNLYVDNTTSGGGFAGGIVIDNMSHIYISNVEVYGGQGSGYQGTGNSYPGGNTDDGIVMSCYPINYGSPCTDVTIDYFRVDDVYDSGVEFAGPWSYVNIQHGTINRPFKNAFSCYNTFHCGLDNITISNNSATGSAYSGPATRLVDISGPSNETGSNLTNFTFTYNALTDAMGVSGSVSLLGYSLSQFATVSGVNISNNNFGSGSTLYTQSTSGYSGSGNTCTTLNPSGSVTCP